jgi:hypothetical protein
MSAFRGKADNRQDGPKVRCDPSGTPPGGFDTTRNMVAQCLKVRLLQCLACGVVLALSMSDEAVHCKNHVAPRGKSPGAGLQIKKSTGRTSWLYVRARQVS